MKKLVTLFLVAIMALTMVAAVADETPTLRVFTLLHTEQTSDVEDLFVFKYLEKKFNVKFELEAMKGTDDVDQRLSTMWNDLPDLMLMQTTTDQIMKYGFDQELMLDFTPYMTEELMPNTVKARQDYGSAFDSVMAPNGAFYTLPYIRGYVYANNTGAFSGNIRMNINTKWLEAVNMEKPNTLDEFIDVLRAFKAQDPAGLGDEMIPCIDIGNKVKEYVWNALGFYAGGNQEYGTGFAIKNDKLVLPAYTQEAKVFMEYFKTMYDEGLISPDYFTMDQTTANGLITAGVCGIHGNYTMQAVEACYQDWDAMHPLTSSVNDKAVASINLPVSLGSFASADTKYPELCAQIMDWFYSDEGAMMYQMGPMKGSEEEAMIEGCLGWWIKETTAEDGTVTKVVTNELVESNPTYTLTNGNTAWYYIAGRYDNFKVYPFEYAGQPLETQTITVKDQITGADIPLFVEDNSIWNDDNWDRHWRVTQTAALSDYLTTIRLPDVMLSAEDVERANYLKTAIEDYVKSQTANFITGRRSLDEFDAYQEELKKLGIEEYISIYEAGYANFMTNTFGK